MSKLLYSVKTIKEEQLAVQLKPFEGTGTFPLWSKGIPENVMVASMSRRHSAHTDLEGVGKQPFVSIQSLSFNT